MARVAQTVTATETGGPADCRLRSWSMNSVEQFGTLGGSSEGSPPPGRAVAGYPAAVDPRIAAGPRLSVAVIAGFGSLLAQPPKHQRSRLLHMVVGCAVILAVLTGCSKDPLDINCSDFLTQDNNQQLITAAQWGHPSRDGTYNSGDQLAAGQYVNDLRSYCQGANHRNDSLKNLELRLG